MGAVKRGHRGQEERWRGKSLRFYLPFPAPFLATLIICKSRQSHAAARDKTRVTKYQLPALKNSKPLLEYQARTVINFYFNYLHCNCRLDHRFEMGY